MATQENNTTRDSAGAADILAQAAGLLDILRSVDSDAPTWTDVTVDGANTIIEEIHKRIENASALIDGRPS
jgi:hypothetical protein